MDELVYKKIDKQFYFNQKYRNKKKINELFDRFMNDLCISSCLYTKTEENVKIYI